MSVTKNHLLTKFHKNQLVRFVDVGYGLTVIAPLPETYSIGVGSEITSPFSSFAAEGVAAAGVSLIAGVSGKFGVTTKRLFMGPDQPEISIDIKFEAYYSAYDEVLVPCIKLMYMSTAEEKGITEGITSSLKEMTDHLHKNNVISDELLADSIGTGHKATDDLIKYLRTPTPLTVHFGDIFHLHNTYISNVSVNFSNVLDADFLPMEATVSVTLTPQDPFTKNGISHAFHDRIKVSRQGKK